MTISSLWLELPGLRLYSLSFAVKNKRTNISFRATDNKFSSRCFPHIRNKNAAYRLFDFFGLLSYKTCFEVHGTPWLILRQSFGCFSANLNLVLEGNYVACASMMTNRLSMQDLALAIALPPLWNAVLHGLRHLKLCEKYQISHFDCTEQGLLSRLAGHSLWRLHLVHIASFPNITYICCYVTCKVYRKTETWSIKYSKLWNFEGGAAVL